MKRLILFFVFLLFANAVSFAAEPDKGAAFKRGLIVCVNTESDQDLDDNIFSYGLSMPTQYYGITPRYLDVAKDALPGDEEMRDVRAIMTVFNASSIPNAQKFLLWLQKYAEKGVRIVVVGYPALSDAGEGEVFPETLTAVFKAMGVKYYAGHDSRNYAALRYGVRNKEMVDYERTLPPLPSGYMHFELLDPEAKTYLSVSRSDLKDSESSLVFTGPKGGMLFADYGEWQDPVSFRRKWFVDPFRFIRESLGVEGVPVPTPTTVNGIRVGISHIDADGFSGFSEVDKHKVCAEVIRDEVLTQYDYPVTASVIVAEIDPKEDGSSHLIKVAKSIFALPNVEPASHTWFHPFYWSAANRDERETAAELGAYGNSPVVLDAKKEIVGSIRYINEFLVPPNKKCDVLLWSGDCMPSAKQVAIVAEAGFLNMNGGDTLYDQQYDSLFKVSGLYRPVGKYVQVFTGQANDNILTNLWTGPFYGYRNVTRSMEKTGTPRRLMPVDIYYHYFGAEKLAGLQAVIDVYEWAMKQDLVKLYTSEYIRMVYDFVGLKMQQTTANTWRISEYGACSALRLDSEALLPDLQASKNVIGYVVRPEGVFVHLAAGGESAELALVPADEAAQRSGVYLESAQGRVRDWMSAAQGAKFLFDCFSKGDVVIAGLKPGQAYDVSGNGVKFEQKANESGKLVLKEIGKGSWNVSPR